MYVICHRLKVGPPMIKIYIILHNPNINLYVFYKKKYDRIRISWPELSKGRVLSIHSCRDQVIRLGEWSCFSFFNNIWVWSNLSYSGHLYAYGFWSFKMCILCVCFLFNFTFYTLKVRTELDEPRENIYVVKEMVCVDV